MSASEPLLRVEDLRVEFQTEDGVVHAVDGITYQVLPGQDARHRGRVRLRQDRGLDDDRSASRVTRVRR